MIPKVFLEFYVDFKRTSSSWWFPRNLFTLMTENNYFADSTENASERIAANGGMIVLERDL